MTTESLLVFSGGAGGVNWLANGAGVSVADVSPGCMTVAYRLISSARRAGERTRLEQLLWAGDSTRGPNILAVVRVWATTVCGIPLLLVFLTGFQKSHSGRHGVRDGVEDVVGVLESFVGTE